MPTELSQEEVFSNDIDPLDAIRELRKEEGIAEEDLPIDETPTLAVVQEEKEEEEEKADELEVFTEKKEKEVTTPEVKEELISKETLPPKEEKEEEKEEEEIKNEEKNKEITNEESTQEKVKTYKFKANGQDFEFTQEEILSQFETVFGQSMDYTKKLQKIAPYRKMISALETQGITSEQLNVAIDALKGDKGAIQQLLKSNEIDNYDLTPDEDAEPYVPADYGKNDFQLEIEEVTSKIENDEEYKITVDVIDQQWDNSSREMIANNPGMIQGLHNDIKSGVYDKVSPVAMKMKVLDGNTKSDIEYYMLAGEQVRTTQQKNSSEKTVTDLNKNTQVAGDKFEEASSEAQRKRSAGSTKQRTDRKGVIDYLDDDDETFNAWYEKLERSN